MKKTLAETKTILGINSATASTTGVVELATPDEVIAGTDTTRAVTAEGLAAAAAIYANSRAMSQGVNTTYMASGVSNIVVLNNANNNMGTGDCTIRIKIGANWSESPAKLPLSKYLNSVNRWYLYFNVTGTIQFVLRAGGVTLINIETTVPHGVPNGAAGDFVFSFTRESALTDGSMAVSINGILRETLTLPAGTPPTLDIAASLTINGYSDTRYAATVHAVTLYNRALSAADALDLYRNGVGFADKGASQTPSYVSDFSAGADGWTTISGATVTGNIDQDADGAGTPPSDNWLKSERTDASDGRLEARKTVPLSSGKNWAILVTILNPTGSTITHFGLAHDSTPATDRGTIVSVPAGTSVTMWMKLPAKPSSANILYIWPTTSAGISVSFAQGTKFYIKDVSIVQSGVILDLEPESIQPAPGQWLDSSGNKNHAMQPATGSSLTRPKNDFEFRWTNTWTASSAAQYVGGLNQAVLTVKHCIDSWETRAIETTSVQNLEGGDGSDADRFVAAFTPTTAPVNQTLANRISDGTNLKLVYTPAGTATMTIETIITGHLLE